jgi:Flp pilus assembly protein TadD
MRHDPDPEAALGPLRRAVELRPEYPGAYRALVVLHLRLGRLDDAEAALATLESRWPGSPPAASARRLYEEARGGAG